MCLHAAWLPKAPAGGDPEIPDDHVSRTPIAQSCMTTLGKVALSALP